MPAFTATLECVQLPPLGQPRPPAPGRGKLPAAPRYVVDLERTEVTPTICGYEIGEKLARGGMSVVFGVSRPGTQESFAMKVVTDLRLQADLACEAICSHAKAVSALTSPHIVRTIDAGRLPSGEPFIVMEKLDGEDLSARLARDGALPMVAAVRAVMQACEGLAEAHAAGIVHGDIKPGNLVIITDPFGAPCLKILDFAPSVPNAVDPSDPLVTFSPGYAAPEQLGLRSDIDTRADVWGLGVVLHELVTGRRPFAGESLTEIVRAMKTALPPMTTHRADVPEALEQIVRRCLSQDREQRFARVTDLRAALALVERQLMLGEASLRPATTDRGRTAAPVAVRRRVNMNTLFLATLGPASALVTMTLVRVLLAFLH